VKFLPTDLAEVVLIEPDVHRDARGFFLETWHARKYEEGGWPIEEPILSEKDRSAPRLGAIEHLLPRFERAGR